MNILHHQARTQTVMPRLNKAATERVPARKCYPYPDEMCVTNFVS